MTNIEYEVVGTNGDDEEWCAGSDSKAEALHYASQYSSDYEIIRVYEVTKRLICEIEESK